MNKITTIGRLTGDPETRQAGSTTVTNFGLASDSTVKDNDTGRFTPVFYRVSVWGKQGENAQKYLHKGDMAAISGDLATRSYKKNDGTNGFEVDILNASVTFMPRPRTDSAAPRQSAEPDRLPF